METKTTLSALTTAGIISETQAEAISDFEKNKTFSVHGELRAILYLGTLLFTTGIGILVYENIDTIGHQVIMLALASLTAGCFTYTFRKSPPFSRAEPEKPHRTASYVLLLGCTTFLVLEGYAQHQYQIFGTRYVLAVLLPTILFFFAAYRFDHTGVLSLGITGLASWLGLTIAPLSVFAKNDFTDGRLIWSATILGILLVAIGIISEKIDFKKHFAFTYLSLGGNLALAAAFVGLIKPDHKLVFFLISIALSLFFIRTARKAKSRLYLLMGVIYAYLSLSYGLFYVVGETAAIALSMFYLLFSSVGVIYFLLNFKRILGTRK